MIDPETTRLAAHALLDAASVQSDDEANDDQRDEMLGLAQDHLAAMPGLIRVEEDRPGHATIDIRRLVTASLLVINGLLDVLVAASGADRDELIVEMRQIIDDALADEVPDQL